MTKNFKGGYKIVSLNGNDLASGDSFVVNGLYENLVNSYKKPILVTEIVIDGEKQQDSFAVVKQSDGGYKIDVYDYALTVTSEDSVSAVALPEITSIGNGLTLTDGELSVEGGGSALYRHDIYIHNAPGNNVYDVVLLVYSHSNAPLNSFAKLKAFFNSSNDVVASGYCKTSNHSGLVIKVSFTSGTDYTLKVYDVTANDTVTEYIGGNVNPTDTVTEVA